MPRTLKDKNGIEFEVGQIRALYFAAGPRGCVILKIDQRKEGMEMFTLFDLGALHTRLATIGIMETTELV
jgi:hypothetical protein